MSEKLPPNSLSEEDRKKLEARLSELNELEKKQGSLARLQEIERQEIIRKLQMARNLDRDII